MAVTTPQVSLGWKAADFDLLGVDGKRYTLANARGSKGLLVMFICNHCPYVQAIRDKIVRDTRELRSLGIGSVGIMSNDTDDYPEDSFENMKKAAQEFSFPFPYVIDETQEIAKTYDAMCTPDFFGFDKDLKLQYRGRLDASGRSSDTSANRELFNAMKQIAETGKGPKDQKPSMGCSIKWKR